MFGLIGIMLYKLMKVILFSIEANETQTKKHIKIIVLCNMAMLTTELDNGMLNKILLV